MVERVVATEKALDFIARLKAAHGALLLHQSGGCCDGSSPMCLPQAEWAGIQRGGIGLAARRAFRGVMLPRTYLR